jgi:hypothetical protein
MPYKSDKQRRYMHAKLPKIAAKWDAEIRKEKAMAKKKLNMYGLTYARWLAAAHLKANKTTKLAWEAGEDPADYRARTTEHPFIRGLKRNFGG